MPEFEKEQKICKSSSSSSEHGLMKKALEITKQNNACASGLLSKITKSSLRAKNMTKAIVEQNKTLRIQRFENTFFKMLEVQQIFAS